MKKPFFTIIIVSYNAGDKLFATLDSVLGQSYSNYRIFIKDGMSTDGSMDKLKEKYDVELKADWERILSKKDLDLLEALSLLSFIQRSDYWDYEHMPLSYAIFDGTVDNILESIENHIDEENIGFLNIFVK